MAVRCLVFVLLTLCGSLTSCNVHFFGSNIQTAKTIARAPGNVQVHVSVEDDGEPVGYLNKNNFTVYENNVELNNQDIAFKLLPLREAASAFTVVLLDLSQSPTDKELDKISRGAAHFAEKVTPTQPVVILAFDGSPRVREVARLSQVEERTKRALPNLKEFLSEDPSRDLNSSLLAAIVGLTNELKHDAREVHLGNIVTLLRGPDLAGRKSEDEVSEAIKNSGFAFFSLAPEGLSFSSLPTIGKDKRLTYQNMETLPLRFQDLGIRVRAAWESHYILSYCSPARAGTRQLTVKVNFDNEEGKKRSSKSRSEFDATGFERGCLTPPPVLPEERPPIPVLASEEPVEPEEIEAPKKKQPRRVRRISKPSKPEPIKEGFDEETTVVAPPSSGKYE